MPPITATRAIAKIREAKAVGAAVYIYAIADAVVRNDVERRVKNTASVHSQENVGHVIKKPAAIWKTSGGLRRTTRAGSHSRKELGGPFEPVPMSNSLINGFPIR
jgi:hypothetical protein